MLVTLSVCVLVAVSCVTCVCMCCFVLVFNLMVVLSDSPHVMRGCIDTSLSVSSCMMQCALPRGSGIRNNARGDPLDNCDVTVVPLLPENTGANIQPNPNDNFSSSLTKAAYT